MEFFYQIKATQKSGKQDAVIWFTAKSEARAALTLDVALEDAGIETGRGKDYAKPVRTDMPVINDLPEEGSVCFEFCKRYALADDQRTWNVIPDSKTSDIAAAEEHHEADSLDQLRAKFVTPRHTLPATSGEADISEAPKSLYEHGLKISEHDDGGAHYPVCKMPFRKQLLAQLTVDELRHHITRSENAELHALEMDTDNGYVQDLLLAAENFAEVKAFDTKDLWRYTNAIRKVFSMEKRHELGLLLQFTKAWVATPYIDRGILTREWTAGNRINLVQRTDAGTNADGGYVTDRGVDAHHTLDTLDLEIACALLPMDFNHREIPGGILRRAKEIVTNKDQDWKFWSKILRNQPGVLAVNRAAIFNLVRIAPEDIHLNPVAHLEFVNRTMTAEFNAATELLPLPAAQPEEIQTAKEHPLPKWAEAGEQKFADESEAETQILPKWANAASSQPQVGNLGSGVYSIEGLMNEKQPENDDRSSVTEETTSDVQTEETDPTEGEAGNPVQPGESADATDPQTDAVAETVCTGCGGCPDCGAAVGDATYADMEGGLKEELEALAADTLNPETMFTHLMVDLETMGKKPGAPIVSVGAVFFDPATGKAGAEFYQVINLESSMSFGARPDASTILWWLKQSPEARSAILVDDTVGLVEALEQFLDFVAENAANGSKTVQLWGNGSSFDCSLLEAAFELADTPFPIPHWNYRDVRTVVELGEAVGLNSRYEIPFEGDKHNALADARHQVKYVSAIWQRLTKN
ncbi:Exodeoxyribonuclease VIII-like protein [Leclercia adecarboxylata]|uniref:exonuclease n=1 Tax=Leclercia adecarboxylata TaxID=83655 RepID=UPI003B2581A8